MLRRSQPKPRNRLPLAILSKLSERFGAIVSENYVIIYNYLEIIIIFV